MALMTIGPSAWAVEPLVDADWVTTHLNHENIRILDLQPLSKYLHGHIPGAVHTHYADWRKTDRAGTPGMLPPEDYLGRLIGGLGIDNQTHVVLVPPGYHVGDLAMATRVYWTLKMAGHDKISILNGGMADYVKAPAAQLDHGEVRPEGKAFSVRMRREDTPVSSDILQASENNITIVDSRSPGEYIGKVGSNADSRSGTIPGAVNLPYNWLSEKDVGRFPDRNQLKLIFKEMNLTATKGQIHFCHTGHRASLTWFVSHELLGNHQAKLYDGSMAEWAKNPALPMVSQTPADR